MNILIVAATAFEIVDFTTAKPNYPILITGVGIPNTLYHLQKVIANNNFDLVIQAGIAGAFTNEFELSETVLVKQDTFGDIGLEEKNEFTPIFESDLFYKNEFPFTNGWLINNENHLKQSNLELVKAITVNKVSDNGLIKEQQIKNFDPEIETMEGAAFHYVCLQEKIPFIQLRSISNYVGERDKTKWKIQEAIGNLNRELLILINQLTN
jgi:futalosine hydrolase